MATTYSGRYGQLDITSSAIAEVTSWSLTTSSDVSQWGYFGGSGYKDAQGGNVSGSGTFEGKYDWDQPIEDFIEAGDEVTLLAYLTTTASGAVADRYITVPVVISELTFNTDGDTGDPVSYTASFVTRGQWTMP